MPDIKPQNSYSEPKIHDAKLKKQIKWVLLLRVFLISFLLGVSSLLKTTQPGIFISSSNTILIFIFFIYIFSIVSASLINKLNKYQTFVYLQILADVTFTTIIIYYSGGSRSIFTFVYFFPLITSGLLLFMRGAFVFSSFSVICYAFILSTEHYLLSYYFPYFFSRNPPTQLNLLLQIFSVYGLCFFLVSILSAVLARRLHKTEEALTKTSRNLDVISLLYKQIFDDISSGIITIDSEGTITSFNPAAEEITGHRANDVVGSIAEDIFIGITAEAEHQHRSVMNLTRKDGEIIPVGFSWAKLHMPGDQGDYRVYTLQDLSKIKQMEAQVKQSEKMAAIGKIAAGIAHEFRNPLAAISGAAQVLSNNIDHSKTNQSLLKIITRECSRLERNINDFLQFSKPAEPEKTWNSVQTLALESWDIIQQAPSGYKSELLTDFQENLDCWGDQHQLKQVFINLLHNASMACESTNGSVTVSAHEKVNPDGKDSIMIIVSDSGCGIPDETMSKIFEPFYTTKENGTGLGLAIVKQIVDGHNGTLDVTTTIEQGSTFRVQLPLP